MRLYHYTTFTGALGILDKKEIWATSIHFLNDSEEFRHGIGLASDIAKDLMPSQGPNGTRFLEKVIEFLDIVKQNFVCVASFTEQDDLLSQWRGYAVPGGVALGFDMDALQEAAQAYDFMLLYCIYDDNEKITVVTDMLERSLQDIEAPQFASPTVIWNHAESWVADFDVYASAFKHRSFSEEKEWRLTSGSISVDLPQVAVRPGFGLPIPYFKLPLAKPEFERETLLRLQRDIGLRSITVGPHREQELAEKAMRTAAAAARVRVEEYKRSLIPYRSV